MNNYNNIIDFYKEYIKMEQVIRKGWLMCNVPSERLESVGDHTLQLMMLASVITKELNIEIDLRRLMEMLLIHDLGEIIIGDISEVEANTYLKKQDEDEAVKSIFSKLSKENAEYYFSLWLDMYNKESDLAKFAYLLDKIDAVIKAGVYEKDYNLDGLFEEFYSLQQNRCTFDNTILNDFFLFIKEKFGSQSII